MNPAARRPTRTESTPHAPRVLASLALCVLLPACGGGGGGGGTDPAPGAIVTATGTVSSKVLTLTWSAASGATSYQVQKRVGAGSFANDGAASSGSTLSTTRDLAVHLTDWVNTRYRVQACNAGGCTSSAEIDLLAQMLDAIGYLKASNTATSDQFGISLALSADGSTLAVGATNEDSSATGIDGDATDNSASSAGAVYVFARSGGVWTQQAYVKASNTGAVDRFGWSVALSSDGNTLAVGAPLESSAATGLNGNETDNSAGFAGAAYVFVRSGSTWSQQAYVKASNTGAGDQFGVSVALSADGNTLAVGAQQEASSATVIGGNELDDSAPGAGASYVFLRSAGSWAQQAYVKASNAEAGDQFGASVALSADGNTLGVGATAEDSGSAVNPLDGTAPSAGAAYVFVRSGAIWTQQAYVKASNSDGGDEFGRRLALSADGNTLAVSAVLESGSDTGINGNQADNSAGASGAAYVFVRSAGSWSQQAYVKASNTQSGDNFGEGIALSADGSTLAVGAWKEDSNASGISGDQSANTAGDSGAVYVFTRDGSTWSQQSYVKASNTGAGDEFGASVSLSTDGTTLAVGAASEAGAATGVSGNQADNAAPGAGSVYVY